MANSTIPSAALPKIIITFDPKDGKWTETETYGLKSFTKNLGDIPQMISDEIYQSGYKFLGWGVWNKITGNNDPLFMYHGIMPFYHNTVRFVPAWKEMKDLTATFTFGENITTQTFKYASAPNKPADPESDKIFLGWVTATGESVGFKPTQEGVPYTHYYTNISAIPKWSSGFGMQFEIPNDNYELEYPLYTVSVPSETKIYWGDGVITTIPANTNISLKHTYIKAGTYNVIYENANNEIATSLENNDTYKQCLVKVLSPLPKIINNSSNASSLFNGCQNLVAVPERFFQNNPQIKDISYSFYNCKKLANIPEMFFSYIPDVENLQSLFANCSVLNSPKENTFKYNTKITNCKQLFQDCNNITNLPEDLFKYCPEVTTFEEAFRRTGIVNIPPGLFKYCTKVTSFKASFEYMGHDIVVPDGLFDNCVNVTTFENLFSNTHINTVPSDLFKYCTKVTNFKKTLNDANLSVIPEDLFKYCPEVTTFEETIAQNTLVESIPRNLFKYNLKVTNCNRLFYQLTNLSGDIYIYSEIVSSANGLLEQAKDNTGSVLYARANSVSYTTLSSLSNSMRANMTMGEMPVTVTFIYDNGQENVIVSLSPTGGQLDRPENPIKEGYRFDYWVDQDNNEFLFDLIVLKDTVLTAKYTKMADVVVTFDSNGGTSVLPQTILYNSLVTKPTDPTKNDYFFTGWKLNGNTFNFNTRITENITLFANFVNGFMAKFNFPVNQSWYFPFIYGSTSKYNAQIDWGDGTITDIPAGTTHSIQHTYTEEGEHTILYTNDGGEMPLITSETTISYDIGGTNVPNLSMNYLTEILTPFLKFPCSSLRDAGRMFMKATALTSIPENLFSLNPQLTEIAELFAWMQDGLLTTIPENLFANLKYLRDVNNLFFLNKIITAIPENLFANNPELENVNNLFEQTTITSIPENLFANNKKLHFVNNFVTTTNNITTIPENLFKASAANIRTIDYLASGATGLTSFNNILKHYFPYITGLSHVFYNAVNIKGDLYIGCSGVTSGRAMQLCNGLNNAAGDIYSPYNSQTLNTINNLGSSDRGNGMMSLTMSMTCTLIITYPDNTTKTISFYPGSTIYNFEDFPPEKDGYKLSMKINNEEYTFWALWEDTNIVCEYIEMPDITISFDPQNGEDIITQTIPYNSQIEDLPTVIKDGYYMVFWGVSGSNERYDLAKRQTENITVYANWEAKDQGFVFEINSMEKSLYIPLTEPTEPFPFSFTIDWGDGTEPKTFPAGTPYTSTDLRHQFPYQDITYRIKITSPEGKMPDFVIRSSDSSVFNHIRIITPFLHMVKDDGSEVSCGEIRDWRVIKHIPDGLYVNCNFSTLTSLNGYDRYSAPTIPFDLLSKYPKNFNFSTLIFSISVPCSIPKKLLSKTESTSFAYLFNNASYLRGDIYIYDPFVTTANNMVNKCINVNSTIFVPTNSTTEKTIKELTAQQRGYMRVVGFNPSKSTDNPIITCYKFGTFTDGGKTYYGWQANNATCTSSLPQTEFEYNGVKNQIIEISERKLQFLNTPNFTKFSIRAFAGDDVNDPTFVFDMTSNTYTIEDSLMIGEDLLKKDIAFMIGIDITIPGSKLTPNGEIIIEIPELPGGGG